MSSDKIVKSILYDNDEDEEYDSDIDSDSENSEYESFIDSLSNEDLDYLIENNSRNYIEDISYSYRSPKPINLPSSFEYNSNMVSLRLKIIKKNTLFFENKKKPTLTWVNNNKKIVSDVFMNEQDFPSLSKDTKQIQKQDDIWIEVSKKKKNKIIVSDNNEYNEIKKCAFDTYCKYVKKDKFGTYKNINKEKNCSYLHLNENIENYNSRTETKYKQEFVTEKIQEDRNKAFEILKDKEKIKSTLKYTKMCSSILNNIECPHKNNCRFAHNTKELNVKDCFFANNCKFIVKTQEGKYININEDKICDYKHLNENIIDYHKRISFKKNENKKIYIKAPKRFTEIIKNMEKRNNLNIILEVY